MYHIFYPDPLQSFHDDSCAHETADTEAEMIETVQRAAAKWRGLYLEMIMVFDDANLIDVPEEINVNRCPHCGCTVDINGFDVENATEDDYDDYVGTYKLGMACPECEETIHAWFKGDVADRNLEFKEIDEYDCSP